MTVEMWLTLAILVAAIVLFVTEWLRVDVVALGVVVLLMLTGILTTGEALAGFSDSAVLTITALFIVGGAVLQTGLAGMIGDRILRIAGTNETRLILVIMLAVAFLSGFLSNTGTVAVLLPAIVGLAASANLSPSKLLMPLTFGSMVGGATTLIGTPPNIIVSNLLAQSGQSEFDFFSFTPVGLVVTAATILFMVTIGRRLLPDHRPRRQVQQVRTPEELVKLYRLPDNLFRLRVPEQSPLVGQNLEESQMGHEYNVSVLEVLRANGGQPTTILPNVNTVFQAGDVLIVRGASEAVSQAAAVWKLGIQPASVADQRLLVTREIGIAEVVIPYQSALEGKTLEDVRFGSTHRLTVLDIRRPGVGDEDEALDLKNTPLNFGDTLLVQGEWKNIVALKERGHDFIVTGSPEAMAGMPKSHKAPVALAVLAAMLALMVTGVVSVTAASMLAGLAMVLTGCLTMDEAYASIDWRSVVLIAGMLPMSTALDKVGLVSVVATGFTGVTGGMDPRFVLGGLFLLTAIFTQVLSNTATTVLVAPIALAMANDLGLDPHAFMLAVAVAASMAFASPVASPTNTLVMGAGGYRFVDYLRIGTPLILITMLLATLVLPLLWPM